MNFIPWSTMTYLLQASNTMRWTAYGRLLKGLIICSICLRFVAPTGEAHGFTIPPYAKDCVTFIFSPPFKDNNGQEKEGIPLGTGFFVIAKIPENQTSLYLVTNKHVIQDKSKHNYSTLFIRLNKRDGGAEKLPVRLIGEGAARVYTYRDPNVDLAVIEITPDPSIYYYTAVPLEMMATAETVRSLKITEGDDVFFTGLFTPYYGKDKNYPVVRWGKVALLTDETVPWKTENDKEPLSLHLYLVEALSFGGNSGSPVFFYLAGMRNPSQLRLGLPELHLAGVMMGYYFGDSSGQNAGIAAVVPAHQLRDLFSDTISRKDKPEN